MRTQFLSLSLPLDLKGLNTCLGTWIDTGYHHRWHSVTGQTPLERFTAQMECLRPTPSNLEDYFRKRARRRVEKDRSVSLHGRLFEAPVPLIGKPVTLLYHDHDPTRVEVLFEEHSFGFLQPLDLRVNARVRRGRDCLELIPESKKNTDQGGRLSFYPPEEETP